MILTLPHISLITSLPPLPLLLTLTPTRLLLREPRMPQHALDIDSLLRIPIQHRSHQRDRILRDDKRNAEIVVRDFVDRVKWVLLVDDRIE